MQKTPKNLAFLPVLYSFSRYFVAHCMQATLWTSRSSGQFLGRFVATLLILSFIIPPALVPGFLYADEGGGGNGGSGGAHNNGAHNTTPRGTGTEQGESALPTDPTKPTDPDHSDTSNVPPSFDVVPGERGRDSGRKENRNNKRQERPARMMGGDTGTSKNVATIIPNLQRQTSVNQNDGSLSYEYEFALPAGRNGLTPEISLVYSSNNTKNDSIVGYGWSFSIPSIERVNKHGSDNLYTSNDFSSSLSGELIAVSTSTGSYISKTETGDFLAYTFINNKWIVYDKNGTRYFFGSTTQARQDDTASTTRVYKWMLEEIRDANDNFIRYEYFKDAGQIYPENIFYTGHGSTDGIFHVGFNLEAYIMSPTVYYAGFPIKTNHRIVSVEVKKNDFWTRKYALAYISSDSGVYRLLDSIIESSRDEVSLDVVIKNPNVFKYKKSDDIGWDLTEDNEWELPFYLYHNEDGSTQIQIKDINADTYPDVLFSSNTENDCDSRYTFINNTVGGWVEYGGCTSWNIPVFLRNSENIFSDHGTRSFDYNGDMLNDLIWAYSNGNGDNIDAWQIYKNIGTSTGWILDESMDFPIGFVFGDDIHADNAVQVVDVNGDSLQDLVYAFNSSFQGIIRNTYLNTGSGWQAAAYGQWVIPKQIIDHNPSGSEIFTHVQIEDVNGDGLPDVFWKDDDSPANQEIYINNGGGWIAGNTSEWGIPIPFQTIEKLSFGLSDVGTRVTDVNGDGASDIISSHCINAGCDSIPSGVYLNEINGQNQTDFFNFEKGISVPEAFVDSGNNTLYSTLADINADGLGDIVYSYYSSGSTESRTHLNKATPFTDMLIGIETPEGATSSVSYKMSSKYFDENDNLLNPQLPLLVKTVESIKTNDGFGNISEETYKYASGTYYYNNPHDRKFAGFGRVEKTDALGNVSKTYFHQGNYTATSTGEYDDHPSKIGKPYLVEQYDNSGNLFSRTINTWDKCDTVVAGGATSSFVKLTQTLEMTYDGDSDHKDKAQTFTYHNTMGNITSKTEYGEVTGAADGTFSDTGSDTFVTSYTYATSTATSSLLYGIATSTLPARELVKNQAGATVSDTKMYYDTQAFGVLTVGNMTKQEMLATSTAATSTYIDIEKTYNSYGMVTQEKDPRDKVTTYTYDTHNLYPATTTNPLGHTTSFVYDYSAGKPTQVTDANGRTFQVVYDGLDRVTQEKQPDPASPSTLVIRRAYVYNDNTFPTSIVQVDELSSTLSVPTYTYFDGLGRPIQERKKTEASNTYSVKDTAYDTRGMKAKESLPYFSTGSARTSALSANSKLWNHLGYDAVGRIKTISNVVGTTTNTYDDWKLTVTDARGKAKDLTKDARGNLVRVDEKNGTSTYSTFYEWNGLGSLMKITDALGNVRNFAYDNLGRRTFAEDLHAVSDMQFSSSTYSYDATSNLISMIDGKGQIIQYSFDDINRPLTEDYTGQGGSEVLYKYDVCANGKGKLCFATTSSAVSGYTYDALGRMATESISLGRNAYATSYEYDKQGNQIGIVLPDLSEVKYVYNDGGLVERIERKDVGGSFVDVVEDLDYSPEGKITFQANANDTETINEYDEDALYRLQNRYTENGLGGISPVLQDISYTYDAVGNITEIDDESPMNNGRTVLYAYDDLSRLASASTTFTGNGQGYKEEYVYDPIGNFITKGAPINTYVYQGTTTGLYANPHAVTKVRTDTYVYDKNGNMLSDGKSTSTWNYNNRMTQRVEGATTTTYEYDHSGERVKYGNGLFTTYYPHKYWNIEPAWKQGTSTIVATSTTSHIFLGDMMVATVEKQGTTTTMHYHHTDHLSGAGVTTGPDGEVSEVTDYYPYGDIRYSYNYQGFTEQRKFTGHEYDQETDLTYMGARYYDGTTGRFRSVDPIFIQLGSIDKKRQDVFLADPQQLNSYSYVRNNPINLKDKTGKCIWDGCAAETMAVVSFIAMYAPQILSFGQSLLSPIGQAGINQAIDDANNGRYGLAVFGALTAGEVPSGAYSGLLRKSESMGGHALRLHVGQTTESLLSRIDSSPRLNYSTSFSSELMGDFATHQNIQNNLDRIAEWMANPSIDSLPIKSTLPNSIGFGVDKSGNVFSEINDITTVLHKTVDKGSYFVKTSFPQIYQGPKRPQI